jgi:hypothetical protein
MLIKEFIIKDIINYELVNDVNILEELSYGNFDIVLDVIKLGLKCSDEDALKLLEEYIDKYGYEQTIKYLAYDLIGKEPSDTDDKTDVSDYKSFSDILETFYNEIQTVDKNLSLSDFWNISTRYMYRYAEGLKSRYTFNLNQQSKEQFLNAETFLGLLFGKLKKPLQFDENGNVITNDNKTVKQKLDALRKHEY